MLVELGPIGRKKHPNSGLTIRARMRVPIGHVYRRSGDRGNVSHASAVRFVS
jgi:hypothetical protein